MNNANDGAAYLVAMVGVVGLIVFLYVAAGQGRPKRPIALICGATGVGKSTLINVLVGREAALVGVGQPVTINTCLVDEPSSDIAFYDSRGLEVEDASHTYLLLLADLLRLRFDRDVRQQIDLVVMCIAEPSARIDDAHQEIANLCEDLRVPLGIVLTKAQGGDDFRVAVRETFRTAQFVQPVRALPLETAAVTIPQEGIDELRHALQQFAVADLGEAKNRAARAPRAQRLAEAARDMVNRNSDAAWVSLAGSAYQYLIAKPGSTWNRWLADSRGRVKQQLVPGFFRRTFNTKFDDGCIDGELARRIFPSILRHFSLELDAIVESEASKAVLEAGRQLEERRPYRSRF